MTIFKSVKLTYKILFLIQLIQILSLSCIARYVSSGSWLRPQVKDKIYMIKGNDSGGGGTGFSIKTPSGASYVITNAHVCEAVMEDNGNKFEVIVYGENNLRVHRRILKISETTDLCLIEGIQDVSGLSIGTAPKVGDDLIVIGHPHLKPLSVATGEMIGVGDVKTVNFYFTTGDLAIDTLLNAKDGTCNKPKNRIINVDGKDLNLPFSVPIKTCFSYIKAAYQTNVVIYPGNSGSPVFNTAGEVVGVAFSVDEINWGWLISQNDLTTFLAGY